MGHEQIDNWAQLVAVAVPFIAAVIMRTHWSTQTKALAAGVVAVVLGVVSVGVAGGFSQGITWTSWVVQVSAVYGAAQAIYALFRPAFKKIETATSVHAAGGYVPRRRNTDPIDDADPVDGYGTRRPKDWRDDMPDE